MNKYLIIASSVLLFACGAKEEAKTEEIIEEDKKNEIHLQNVKGPPLIKRKKKSGKAM